MIRDFLQVTIADTATSSAAFRVDGAVIVGIVVPAEFDGTILKFQAGILPPGKATPKDDFTDMANFTFYDTYDTGGTQTSYTTAASRYIVVPRGTFDGVNAAKLVSGTAQTGATILTLVLMPLGG